MSTSANRSRAGSGDNHARNAGLFCGILVFLLGVALLGYVFVLARHLFDAPPPPIPAAPPAGSPATATTPAATSAIGQSLIDFLEKLLLMFLMCVAGSLVAGQGVNLFFKALAGAHPHLPVPDTAPAPTPETSSVKSAPVSPPSS